MSKRSANFGPMSSPRPCCCSYGAAVRGEWPEFQCYHCKVHTDDVMAGPNDMCKRHRREVEATYVVPDTQVVSARELLEEMAHG